MRQSDVTIFGIDVHPDFQVGLNIEQVRAEGFDFIAVKVSEATNTYGGQDWLRRAKACGLIPIAYHYLRPGNEDAQAQVFANQLRQADVPGMLDAEALTGDGRTPTLTVASIHQFLDACANLGARIPLLYLPRWYHQRMGSPDLSGLPMLWSSSYVTGSGYASSLYESVTPSYWSAYGGLPVAVLQFTDRALVAGQHVDADAYIGTRDDFAKLVSAGAPSPQPTPSPKPDSIPSMEYGQTSDTILKLQQFMNRQYPLYSHITPETGFYGSQTQSVIREFQRRSGISEGDGANVGRKTAAALAQAGFRP